MTPYSVLSARGSVLRLLLNIRVLLKMKKNSVDSKVPYLSDNLTTPQIHIENDTKMKEPKTLQPKVLVSTDPHLNRSCDLQNDGENKKKKGEFEILGWQHY